MNSKKEDIEHFMNEAIKLIDIIQDTDSVDKLLRSGALGGAYQRLGELYYRKIRLEREKPKSTTEYMSFTRLTEALWAVKEIFITRAEGEDRSYRSGD